MSEAENKRFTPARPAGTSKHLPCRAVATARAFSAGLRTLPARETRGIFASLDRAPDITVRTGSVQPFWRDYCGVNPEA
jgi:hypothetical protein